MPTRPVKAFGSIPTPNQVIDYAHSPNFRFYLLSTHYLPANILLLKIPLLSRTFYNASWTLEYLKNAVRNVLRQFLPGVGYEEARDTLKGASDGGDEVDRLKKLLQ